MPSSPPHSIISALLALLACTILVLTLEAIADYASYRLVSRI